MARKIALRWIARSGATVMLGVAAVGVTLTTTAPQVFADDIYTTEPTSGTVPEGICWADIHVIGGNGEANSPGTGGYTEEGGDGADLKARFEVHGGQSYSVTFAEGGAPGPNLGLGGTGGRGGRAVAVAFSSVVLIAAGGGGGAGGVSGLLANELTPAERDNRGGTAGWSTDTIGFLDGDWGGGAGYDELSAPNDGQGGRGTGGGAPYPFDGAQPGQDGDVGAPGRIYAGGAGGAGDPGSAVTPSGPGGGGGGAGYNMGGGGGGGANNGSDNRAGSGSGGSSFVAFGATTFEGGTNHQNLAASASIAWVPCPPPTAPVADNDFYTTPEDTSLTVTVQNLLVGDYDINPGDTVSVDVSAGTFFQSAHGIYVVNDNGNFTYWPNDNFTGTDTFTYRATDGSLLSELATVTIEVTPVNDAPVANNDDYNVAQDNTLTVPAPGILDNDTDPDSGSLTPTIVDTPSHGLLVPAADGSFVYTPDTGYVGTDTFTYTNSDGQVESNTATVTITVTPANVAPVAVNDAYTVAQGGTLNVPAPGLLDNDTDPEGDTLTPTISDLPAHGILSPAADGSFVYTPAVGYFGTDTFTYTVSDGKLVSNTATVTINITPKPVVQPPRIPETGSDSLRLMWIAAGLIWFGGLLVGRSRRRAV